LTAVTKRVGFQYGPPPDDMMGDLEMNDETQYWLSQLLPKRRKVFRIKYEYDFGDSWLHEILFEGLHAVETKTIYPRCVAGARACPPEDIGGVYGYYDRLDALADPTDEYHDDAMGWLESFDPKEFDRKKVTAALERLSAVKKKRTRGTRR
jgi:hypothetical protein